jgi:predicted amidohydrolase YtcJ
MFAPLGLPCRAAGADVAAFLEEVPLPGLVLVARIVWGSPGPTDPLGRRHDLAVEVDGGRITAVVPAARVRELRADRVVDLGDVTLLPGFVDAHVHLTPTGLALGGGDLRAVRSADDLLAAVRLLARTAPADGPLWGHGFDDATFQPAGLPRAEAVAEASGGRPVYLSRVCGHQGLATLDLLADADALEAVGCDRDQDGLPTGVVRSAANLAARRHTLDALPAAALAAAQDRALALAARHGVTCVHEMGSPGIGGRRDFELLLDRADALPVEVVGYWGELDFDYVASRKLNQVGGDLWLDGSLGARTAALSTPYQDAPGETGSLYHHDDELVDLYVRASLAGVQVAVHAIGDLAIGQVLRCARRAARTVGRTALAACRHRVEHAELLGSDGADRIAELGLAVSVQPAFDAAWGGPGGMYIERLGARRAKSMNPFADLWARGVPMAGGSDANVTPLDPWNGVAAAVHHNRSPQRLGLPVALELFTLGGRVLARQERVTGRIHPGQRADLTVFAGDVLAGDPARLRCTEAVATLVAGRLVHGPADLAVETAAGPGLT